MKVNFFILIIITLHLFSCENKCSSISPDIWKKIDPYSDSFEKNIADIKLFLKSSANRKLAMDCVSENLDSFWLSHDSQIRLGVIVSLLEDSATNDEVSRICSLISMGSKFSDYYGLVLSVEPAYFLCSITALKSERELIAHFPHPDSGKMTEYNIKENFIRNLVKSTGKDFGYDYEKWEKWWKAEGKNLEYDKKNSLYKRKGEGSQDRGRTTRMLSRRR